MKRYEVYLAPRHAIWRVPPVALFNSREEAEAYVSKLTVPDVTILECDEPGEADDDKTDEAKQ